VVLACGHMPAVGPLRAGWRRRCTFGHRHIAHRICCDENAMFIFTVGTFKHRPCLRPSVLSRLSVAVALIPSRDGFSGFQFQR